MSKFLATLPERVLVFDGAFGTWVQDQDLGPDDFGGAALEGCNEHLVLTRPDLIRQMHAEYFEAGVDAVETATFGAFGLVLAEYGIADETFAINEQAARLAQEVAADFSTPERPRFVIGSIGPGHQLPSLGQIAFADAPRRLRGDGRRAARRRRRRPPHRDGPGPPPVQGRDHRCPPGDGHRRASTVPIMVQVTVETTGRLLVGSEIGAALTALEALRPDVIGLNCATGPTRDDRAPAVPRRSTRARSSRACPTRGCRRSSTATRTTTSRPTRSPTRTSASSTSSASTSSAAAAAPRPRTCAPSSSASATARRPRAPPSTSPSCSSIYSPVAVPPGARVPRGR